MQNSYFDKFWIKIYTTVQSCQVETMVGVQRERTCDSLGEQYLPMTKPTRMRDVMRP